jgi:hypothetical protein
MIGCRVAAVTGSIGRIIGSVSSVALRFEASDLRLQ